MITIEIPGVKTLQIYHLVLDFNGTIARDGILIDGVREKLNDLSDRLQIHVITADTVGTVQQELTGIPCHCAILPPEGQEDKGKLRYIEKLGIKTTACIGNGRNDCLMLKGAILGIAVIQDEGAARETIMAADIVTHHILDALNLFSHPLRLVATLRT